MPARTPVTPEDLRSFVTISEPRIDPAGERIVFVRRVADKPSTYRSDLWIVDVDDPDPRALTNGGKDRMPRWSPDGGHIAFVAERDEHRPQVWVLPMSGGEATALTDLPEGSIGRLRWSPDGRRIGFAYRAEDPQWTTDAKKQREREKRSDPPRVLDHWWYRLDGDGWFGAQRWHLLVIDTETGAVKALHEKDTMGFFSFDFTPDGKAVIVGTNTDRRAGMRAWHDDLLRIDIASGRRTRIDGPPRGPKEPIAVSPDGRWVAWGGREGSPDGTYSTENLELWVTDLRRGTSRSLTGGEDACLMAHPISDTSEVQFSAVLHWTGDSRRIVFELAREGECHVASVDMKGGPVRLHTEGRAVHSLGNLSRDGRRAAITVTTPVTLDEVHVATLGARGGDVRALTDLNGPLLRRRALAKPTAHRVKAPDGTLVHTWVMKPPGSKATRHPAVLEIHGGPHTQYGWGFFHEFQVLAGAGYAVVYSNPRGSKGYGRDHCAAIRGAWGRDDWTDIQAVAAWMRERPFIDPARVGIMGGSYGGYMTNWAIGHSDEFAAAITDRCVSNLVSMFGNSDFLEAPDIYWPGDAWSRPEARWEQSPIRNFDHVRTPTLVIHSDGDLRCNVEQAEQVFVSLQLRDVPSRFIRYPRSTSHGMSRSGPPDLRIHRLEQILAWWAQWLHRKPTAPRRRKAVSAP